MGTSNDLEKLTLRPVDSEKSLSISLRTVSLSSFASIITKVSSAYYKMGKSWEWFKGMGTESRPLFLAAFIADCSKSAAKTKRSGERGSPCLTPLLQ